MSVTALGQPLQVVLHHKRLVLDYTFVSAAALLIYDYALTLQLEIKYIWFSPWTYTKVLFLLIRCMSFVDVFLLLYSQIFLNVSAEMCTLTYPVAAWIMIFEMFLSEVVLSIRTWAVWHGNKAIGIVLAALTLAFIVSECIITKQHVDSLEFSPPPIQDFRGCYAVKGATTMWESYAIITAVEVVVFALTAISAFRSYRLGNKGELLHVIHRDGILFYIYLLCFSLLNLLFTLNFPIDMMVMLIPLQNALYSVLTSRIVLNIRDVSNRGVQIELHTDHYESIVFVMPSVQGEEDRHRDSIAWSQV